MTIITVEQPRIAFRPQCLIVPTSLYRGSHDRLTKKRFARLVKEARRERMRHLDRHDRWVQP